MKKQLIILVLLLVALALQTHASFAADSSEQLISTQELEDLFEDFLIDSSDRLPGVELRYADIDLPEPFAVPQGRVEFQLVPAKNNVIGSHRITLITRVDGRVESNLSVRVDLEALADVVVAKQDLMRGELLSEENLALRNQDISRLKQPIFDPEEIYGKRAKRMVRLGEPLSLRQVDFPPMIKRGDRVEIRAQRGGLVLSAVGDARQDGQADELIRVMNSNSRREILARVVAPGLVTVEF